MKPLYAKQIEDEDGQTGGQENEDPQSPMNPAGGGVPRTPRQAPDGS